MKSDNLKFLGTTIGMDVHHKNFNSYSNQKLVRVNFYETNNGNILLQAVSGHNLSTMKAIPAVIISKDDYNDRDFSAYDNQIEFFWAIEKLGFNRFTHEEEACNEY